MPLAIRMPYNGNVIRNSGAYVSALEIGDRKKTAVARQLGRGGLADTSSHVSATLLTLVERADRPARFFDVGAHIGLNSALIASVFGSSGVQVHAFEPTPETLAECRQVDTKNNLGLQTEGIALSDTDGETTLYLSDKAETSNSLTEGFRHSSHQVQVSTATIDSYCAEHDVTPNVLKIDVENHESRTLWGARETLRRSRPWVVCEILSKTDREYLGAVLAYLAEIGYAMYPIEPSTGWHPRDPRECDPDQVATDDWLIAPQPVDQRFIAAFRVWHEAIAQCGPDTNILVPAGSGFPPSWNARYDAPRNTVVTAAQHRLATALWALRGTSAGAAALSIVRRASRRLPTRVRRRLRVGIRRTLQ